MAACAPPKVCRLILHIHLCLSALRLSADLYDGTPLLPGLFEFPYAEPIVYAHQPSQGGEFTCPVKVKSNTPGRLSQTGMSRSGVILHCPQDIVEGCWICRVCYHVLQRQGHDSSPVTGISMKVKLSIPKQSNLRAKQEVQIAGLCRHLEGVHAGSVP